MTNNKTDYFRHLSSMKHFFKTKSEQEIDRNMTGTRLQPPSHKETISPKKTEKKHAKRHECSYCHEKFTRKNNMKIHKWSCSQKIIQEKDRIITKTLEEKNKLFEEKNKLLKKVTKIHQKELRIKDDLLSKYKEDVHYFKQMLLVSGERENKSANSYKYINNTFKETIPLQKLTYKKFTSINKIQFIDDDRPVKDQFVYDIIYAYRHDIIDKYIGGVIVKIYKDGDPSKQSLWIADKSRLKYIIREQNEDNSIQWTVDSNGTRTSELIIDPLLYEIKNTLIKFQEKYCDSIKDKNYSYTEQREIMENNMTIEIILNEIEDGKLRNKILKYISNFFGVEVPVNKMNE